MTGRSRGPLLRRIALGAGGLGLVVATFVYFLPTIVALLREKYDKVSIFLLNFFLGWSVIGWIVALVWACKNDRVVYLQNPQRY